MYIWNDIIWLVWGYDSVEIFIGGIIKLIIVGLLK